MVRVAWASVGEAARIHRREGEETALQRQPEVSLLHVAVPLDSLDRTWRILVFMVWPVCFPGAIRTGSRVWRRGGGVLWSFSARVVGGI